MPFLVSLQKAQSDYPEYKFIKALTPSEQKAAFHVKDFQGQDLCLKIIAPNYSIDRLQREIMALQSIAHTNVARFKEYEFSSKQGQQRHYIVEEYVIGTDLSEKLKAGNQWPLKEAAAFYASLCEGLSALKQVNLVHRDLKPSNIRVRPDGTPVIIDFGLARLLDQPDLTRTSEGAAFGTPAYFAPEQFTGTKYDIDHRTDLFAVGILLYEALVGRHPFYNKGMTIQQLSNAICCLDDYLRVPKFRGLPEQWKLLVSRLLEKERAKRPQSAAQVALILRKIGGA